MSKYLVTGGAGFIGSHLIDKLQNAGHQVRVIDDLSTGSLDNLCGDVETIIGDVSDESLVRECMRDVDGCFHLAAVSNVQQSNEDWLGTHRVNLTGFISILDAARENSVPVVYASSAAVFGDNADMPLTEASDVRPLTAYGADKLGCELHARVASVIHGVPTVGLRFFNVYGPRQNPNSPYSGVISKFMNNLIAGKGVTIFGDGEQTRDFVYVQDVVDMLWASMDRASTTPKIYNVCTGHSVTLNSLVKTLARVLDVDVDVHYETPRTGDIRVSIGDASRIKRELGCVARVVLHEGLRMYAGSLNVAEPVRKIA